jgi:hypothetical protein
MSYQAEISRANPTCFVFLVDHSSSMQDPILGLAGNPKKSDFAANALNKVIQSLIVSASKDLEIRNYFKVGTIGYGFEVKSLWTGELASKNLVWIEDIYQNPLKIEERIRVENDEEGNEVQIPIKYPVWVEPVARGQTQMCAALSLAEELLRGWVEEFPDSFPPTVINITDGEANDGDPKKIADDIRNIQTSDGKSILMTVHVSSNPYGEQIFFPGADTPLPDHFSRSMYSMSSVLPDGMKRVASELTGFDVAEDAHGFVYNADISGIVQALEIGTRPSNIPNQ